MGLPVLVSAHAALETFSGAHGHTANPTITEVLLDFEDKLGGDAEEVVVQLEGVVDLRQLGWRRRSRRRRRRR